MNIKTKITTNYIDDRWFDKYVSIQNKLGETYIALEPTQGVVDDQRQKFEHSNCTSSPDLRPDRISLSELEMIITETISLQSKISSQESNVLIKDAYINVLKELQANANLVLGATRGDYEVVEHENAALYGLPDQDYFASVCEWIRHDAISSSQLLTPDMPSLLEAVLAVVPDLKGTTNLIPDHKTFASVRQLHFGKGGFYNHLFGVDNLPKDAYINQLEGDVLCELALKNIGSDYSLAFSENNIWSTSRDKRLLIRPAGYRLDRDEFIGIVGHEIGSHIFETTNGYQQLLKLLGMGLAGFEKGNEGRAFLREQIVYPEESIFLKQFAWEYIVLLHLSVSLTQGLTGKRHTFPELYKVVYVLYRFWRERRFPAATNNEEYAREEAWYLAVRIFKGSDGIRGAYGKDLVYLEGNLRCWELAKSDPAIIMTGDIGKYDITNDDHVRLLKGLDIL